MPADKTRQCCLTKRSRLLGQTCFAHSFTNFFLLLVFFCFVVVVFLSAICASNKTYPRCSFPNATFPPSTFLLSHSHTYMTCLFLNAIMYLLYIVFTCHFSSSSLHFGGFADSLDQGGGDGGGGSSSRSGINSCWW